MNIKTYLAAYKVFIIFFGTYLSFIMCSFIAILMSYFAGSIAKVSGKYFLHIRFLIPSLGSAKVLICALFKIAKIDHIFPIINNLVSFFALLVIFTIVYMDCITPSIGKNLSDSKRFIVFISILTCILFDGITEPMYKMIVRISNNKEVVTKILKSMNLKILSN